VALDVANAHAARVHAQNLVVESIKATLMLLHEPRLERAVAIARYANRYVPLLRHERFRAQSVSRVVRRANVVLLVVEMCGQLRIQRALDKRSWGCFKSPFGPVRSSGFEYPASSWSSSSLGIPFLVVSIVSFLSRRPPSKNTKFADYTKFLTSSTKVIVG